MTVLERWFEEVWNKGNEAAIDELWVPEKTVHGLVMDDGRHIETKAEFKTLYNRFRTAFPDFHITVEDTVTEGNKTVARVVATGTHTGSGIAKRPSTGKSVRFAGICMARLEDGKVVESWNSWDFMTMYRQLE